MDEKKNVETSDTFEIIIMTYIIYYAWVKF